MMIKNIASAIKQFRSDLGQMKSIRQLIEYFSDQVLIKLASYLLFLWILTPLIIMVVSMFIKYEPPGTLFPTQVITLGLSWYTLLQQIGYMGCILAIIIFAKSVYKAKDANINTQQFIKDNIFTILLFSMLVWSIFSCIASDNFKISFSGELYRHDGLLTYFAYAGIFSCAFIIRNKENVTKLLVSFIIVATILSLFVLIDNESLNQLFKLTPNAAVFHNINHFAYYLCLSIMSAVTLFLNNKQNKKESYLYLLSLSILSAALVKNSSFGPYLATLFGFLFLFLIIYLFDKNYLKRLGLAFSIFMLVTLIMNSQTNLLINELLRLFSDVNDIVENAETAGSAGSNRWELWVNGIKFIFEKPLFGYGPDNLGARYLEAGIQIDRPHNELIQFAASLGIPAALLYISAMLVHFKALLIHKQNLTLLNIGLYGALFAYLASSMLGNTMYYTTPFFFMILGLSVGMIKNIKKTL